MKSKFIPPLKKAVLPEDITSEVEKLAATEIIEHGAGTNSKYYVLVKVESELEILQYDLTEVPEVTVKNFSEKLEDLKKYWLKQH